ncbi:MAG: response regulator [Elusimicrobia bacterium]|nr:response regulator [Elusimicrobiota bacterium]
MKILIADDDSASRMVAGRIVELCGHKPVYASNGTEALVALSDREILVAVCDWIMPGLSGLELIRKVRADAARQYVYFIILTGSKLGNINFMEAMDAGADDYMQKPPDKDLLRVRLRVAQRILSMNTEIGTLKSIIPICSYCGRIRRDDEAYETLTSYIAKNSPIRFSHGICPDCAKKHFPE